MNCTYCNTPNDAANQFCISCGKPLADAPKATQQNALRKYIGIVTARLVISLFGLWILNQILIGLQFAKDLQIPNFIVPTTDLITMLVSVIIMVLLISYTWTLGNYWPRAFPRFREAVEAFATFAYLIILGAVYKIGLPIIRPFSATNDPIVIFQAALLAVALVISIRACWILYHALPVWLVGFQYLPTAQPTAAVDVQPVQSKA